MGNTIGFAPWFDSDAGYAALMRWYEGQLQRVPFACESRTLETRHGETHLLVSGDPGAPPLVMLHGRGVNALTWSRSITRLNRHYRVYAVDIIGEGGRSARTHPPVLGDGYADWLTDVFDGLSLPRARLMGYSFGAWIALKFALKAPSRILRLALLAPGGFTWMRLGLLARSIWAGILPNHDNMRELLKYLSAPGATIDEADVELFQLLIYHRIMNPEPPLPFWDSELKQIRNDALVLIGDHDTVFEPKAVVERAKRSLPNLAHAEIIPHAGHGLLTDAPDAVNERVQAFLQ